MGKRVEVDMAGMVAPCTITLTATITTIIPVYTQTATQDLAVGME